MKLSGAQILLECLLEQGTDTVFGYPGSTILSVYDELYKYRKRIRHILTSHEQGAAHAADGYARATGRPGVCFATSGPGATNLVTGMAAAFMDSSPVVFITCNVPEDMIGKDSFQEVDIIGISMPITKSNYIVPSADKMAETIREAFAVARLGRPGPVLVDIPKNVTNELAEYEFTDSSEHFTKGCLPRLERRAAHGGGIVHPDRKDVRKLANTLRRAKRPLILAGGGIILSNASQELRELSKMADIPVATTLMGLGGIPADDERFIGMAGMHGGRHVNFALSRCDLLIAAGVRFSDRVTGDTGSFAPEAKIVHIDIDRAEIDKNVITSQSILGNVKEALEMLSEMTGPADHSEWRNEIAQKKAGREGDSGKFSPENIIKEIRAIGGDDAIIATDVGEHQMWTAQYYPFSRPRQLITSGGFGAMGFGLGAAIGAKLGCPDMTVFHLTGDGSFRMNCNELATEEHFKAPVITVIFNNGALGMVRQWQTLLYDGRYSCTTLDRGPDFVKLAQAYGIDGYRAEDLEQLRKALKSALASGKGAVIDCVIGIDEKVVPTASPANMEEYILE